MRPSFLPKPIFLFAALLGLTSISATDVSTVPVGYMKVKIAAGAPGKPVETSFAVPLIDEASNKGVATGRIAAVKKNTIKVADAEWAPGKLATAKAPYAVRIKTGARAGLTLPIIDNTADTLTVDTSLNLAKIGLKTGSSGNLVQLVPIDTLDSLFGDDTLIGAKKVKNADVVYLGEHKRKGYFYNTELKRWVSTDGTTKNRGRTHIPPDSAVTIARVGPATTLIFEGRVPETPFEVEVANSGDTYTHTGFPTDITLGKLALQKKIPGWVSSSKPNKADKIAIANGKAWTTYYHTGKKWLRDKDTSGNRNDTVIKAGAPIRITRIGKDKGTTTLRLSLPYSLDNK